MKIKKPIVVIVTLLFMMIGFGRVSAQTSPSLAQEDKEILEEIKKQIKVNGKDAFVMARVNFEEAGVVGQTEGGVKLHFRVENKKDIQPHIRYAVALGEVGSRFSVDTFLYEEILQLNEGEFLDREIEYAAPAYLKGEFNVFLLLYNESGTMLDIVSAGTTKLEGAGNYVKIDEGSCLLSVKGEQDKAYSLSQGVDVQENEELDLNCTVKNYSAENVSADFFVENHQRVFGSGKVTSMGKSDPIVLTPGQEKKVPIKIIKSSRPQAYDAVVYLKDGKGERISNQIMAHYVVAGKSATIQNVRLDKDYYVSGDTAKISFYWTASADIFSGSRLKRDGSADYLDNIGTFSIVDASGDSCAKDIERKIEINVRFLENVEMPIKKDCLNPTVSVSIRDSKGNVFDQNKYVLRSKGNPDSVSLTERMSLKKVILLMSLIIALLGLVLVIVRKFKNGSGMKMTIFLLIMALTAVFYPISKSSAYEFPSAEDFGVRGFNGNSAVFIVPAYLHYLPGTHVVTPFVGFVKLDEKEYEAGSQARAYLVGAGGSCANGDKASYIFALLSPEKEIMTWRVANNINNTSVSKPFGFANFSVGDVTGDYKAGFGGLIAYVTPEIYVELDYAVVSSPTSCHATVTPENVSQKPGDDVTLAWNITGVYEDAKYECYDPLGNLWQSGTIGAGNAFGSLKLPTIGDFQGQEIGTYQCNVLAEYREKPLLPKETVRCLDTFTLFGEPDCSMIFNPSEGVIDTVLSWSFENDQDSQAVLNCDNFFASVENVFAPNIGELPLEVPAGSVGLSTCSLTKIDNDLYSGDGYPPKKCEAIFVIPDEPATCSVVADMANIDAGGTMSLTLNSNDYNDLAPVKITQPVISSIVIPDFTSKIGNTSFSIPLGESSGSKTFTVTVDNSKLQTNTCEGSFCVNGYGPQECVWDADVACDADSCGKTITTRKAHCYAYETACGTGAKKEYSPSSICGGDCVSKIENCPPCTQKYIETQ